MSRVNVAEGERWASALGGAALTVYAVRQLKDRTPVGAALAAAGTALMYRAATGHCLMYSAVGINTAHARNDTKAALGGPRGVNVDEMVIMQRPAEELYAFWRNLEQLPRFMDHLLSVRQLDERRSHWVARALGGCVEWDAEIINDIPNELIAWRTLRNADVVSAGSVRFRPLPSGQGTEVRVRLQYEPPAGKVGATIARLLGQDPSRTIKEDLQRFEQLMDAGETQTDTICSPFAS